MHASTHARACALTKVNASDDCHCYGFTDVNDPTPKAEATADTAPSGGLKVAEATADTAPSGGRPKPLRKPARGGLTGRKAAGL